jgi:hypothetical protein
MSVAADTPAAATQVHAAAAERDTAEVLLGLEVWSGVPCGARQLTTSASPPQQASAASTNAQAWADYIVSPLV